MIQSPFVRFVHNPVDWESEIAWNPLDPTADLLIIQRDLLDRIRENPDGIAPELASILLHRKIIFKSSDAAWADARLVLDSRPPDTGRIVVMPTAGCQFACNQPQYGAYCGQQHTNQKLQLDQIGAVAARAVAIVRSRSLKRFELGFFGGEPLLNEKFIVDALARVGDAVHKVDPQILFEGGIVTNGFRLTPARFEMLWGAGMRRFEITIDGIGDVHDSRRPLKSGIGTFATISRNLAGIAERLREFRRDGSTLTNETEGGLRIRCNVDSRNINSVPELLDFLDSNQLVPPFSFYIAPIRDWGTSKARTGFADRSAFADAEATVFRWMLDRGFVPALLPRRASETCIAMTSTPNVLAPDGHWYACTETPLGTSRTPRDSETTSPQWNDLSIPDWEAAVATGRTPCSTCTFLPVCGGACPKEWLDGSPPCPPYVENWKQRVHIEALRRGLNNLPQLSIRSEATIQDCLASNGLNALQSIQGLR